MPDLGALTDFHFLRPLWLLAIIPAVAIYVLNRRRQDVLRQWRGLIAPHLLPHLIEGGGRGPRLRPILLVVLATIIGAAAAAGPTWEREITPFSEDTAPLVVALDLSRSMDAIDVQPTRLERAKQKVRDLLALRSGARTGLLAYAGSAHMVLPLTDDRSFLETYLAALETDIMPAAGKDAAAALNLAEEMLEPDEVPGSILFITDGIPADSIPAFTEHQETSLDELLVLGVGTSEGGPIRAGKEGFATDSSGRRITVQLDREGLEKLAREADVFVATVTLDDRDVERLQRRIQSHLESVREEDESARWRDVGYYLVLPVAVLGMLWFRRGWTVEWRR